MRTTRTTIGVLTLATLAITGCGRAPARPGTTTRAALAATTADIDSGRVVSQLVKASEGGVIVAADGATLTIPAGALEKDTTITINVPTRQTAADPVLRYGFGPAGTHFKIATSLRIPYENLPGGEAPSVAVYHSSASNPVVDAGHAERTNWEVAEVTARDFQARTVDVKVEHFSFIYACIGIDHDLYLVTDIPGKYLQPGDVVFELSTSSEPSWRPGHVALFCGNRSNPAKNEDRLIEAGANEPVAHDGAVAENTIATFKEHAGIYLGPRRVGTDDRFNPARPLTPEEQRTAVDFAEEQLDKPYLGIGTGVYAEDSWSCVGIVDASLRAAGRAPLDRWATATAATPNELFHATHAVSDIETSVGDSVRIPFYAVTIDHHSPGFLRKLYGWYSKNEPYTLTVTDRPSGSKVTGAAPPEGTGFVFEWTPGPEHAGATFKFAFDVRANTVNGFAYGSRTLEIRVKPLPPPTQTALAPAPSTSNAVASCPICAPLPCRCPKGGR